MPLPLIRESLDQLNSATIYTKLDTRDPYYNLRIAAGDEWKTAFRTQYRLYEYYIMPFGLTNATASFQRWMNEILSEYLDILCVVYLDDILIVSQNLKDQRKHMRTILWRVEQAGLTLKASKYEFHTRETEYLGYIISPKGRREDPNNQGMERTNECERSPELLRVRQLLSAFYQRLQQNHDTPVFPLKERKGMGMG